MLYIAAHPDDENTRLIAYLANEKCLRTGYLSLTRGDGGQNLIGPEQGVELGVIRTQELLAARRIDGGEQFFTRAYDFGFSKTPEETFRKWNKDSVLSDMVWVIRKFRPDIIITRFATDGSGGHGHHTASAILAEEAFDAAGDPTRFPEQLAYVDAWQPRRMFYNATNRFRDPNADMSAFIKLDVGGYNPLLGKSYGEIAAESRSMHKSQGFGSARQRGEYFEYFKPLRGDTAGLKDLFQGMDFTWKRVKGGEKIGKEISNIIKNFDVALPEKSTSSLGRLLNQLYTRQLNNIPDKPDPIIDRKHADCEQIIKSVNGLYYELLTENPLTTKAIMPNDATDVKINLVSRSALRTHVALGVGDIGSGSSFIKPDSMISSRKLSARYRNDQLNGTFWLNNPIRNSMFVIDDFRYTGLPELYYDGNIGLGITYYVGSADSVKVYANPKLQYKWVDPEKGELYRPVVITPPVMINVLDDVITFSDKLPKEFRIALRAGKDSVAGVVKITLPKGWTIELKGSRFSEKGLSGQESGFSFFLAKKGEVQEKILVAIPQEGAVSHNLQVTATVDNVVYSKGIKEIKYDHIPVQTLFPETEVKLVMLDVKRRLKRIGYIPGAGDGVQTCLNQLGYEVVTLTNEKLASEDLSRYEAIVTGVRAYNINEQLPLFRQKLMDYVAAGGNLVVQYNTNSWAGPLNSEIGPYPFRITRDRITDEEAKVHFALPDHPVLNYPNRITEQDFEGWIQERSIYHAGDFGSSYEAPLSMADPGEKANNGALIIAKHGKGNFIYTGLVFFRELPAGVPGAYRLMVNLIELGK